MVTIFFAASLGLGYTSGPKPTPVQKAIAEHIAAWSPGMELDSSLSNAACEYGMLAARSDKAGMKPGGRVLARILWKNRVFDPDALPLAVEAELDFSFWSFLERFMETSILGRGYDHFGACASRGVISMLFTRRIVEVTPPPARALPERQAMEVTFESRRPLSGPKVLMATPAGKVRIAPTRPGSKPNSLVTLISPVDGKGRYLVELVVNTRNGPIVAALFPMFFGVAPFFDDAPKMVPVERPLDPTEARARALSVLQEARNRLGASRLEIHPALERLAYERARQVAVSGAVLVHRLPGQDELLARMEQVNLPVGKAAENLAFGPSPDEAALACLDSPSHLANVIDPRVTHTGVAVLPASGPAAGYVLVQVFAELLPEEAGKVLADRLVDAINKKRKHAGLPLLAKSERLSEIALSHCKAMMRESRLSDELGGGRSLLDLVRRESTVEMMAADLYLTPRLEEPANSPKALNPANRLVGAAVLQEAAAGSRPGRFWIVVIYGRR